MNADAFAEWMRRQVHQVIRTASSYRYDAGPRVLQAFPYHWLITPDENEIRDLMVKHGIAALRYSTPLDFPNGMVSYHVVLNRPYKFEMLRSQRPEGTPYRWDRQIEYSSSVRFDRHPRIFRSNPAQPERFDCLCGPELCGAGDCPVSHVRDEQDVSSTVSSTRTFARKFRRRSSSLAEHEPRQIPV